MLKWFLGALAAAAVSATSADAQTRWIVDTSEVDLMLDRAAVRATLFTPDSLYMLTVTCGARRNLLIFLTLPPSVSFRPDEAVGTGYSARIQLRFDSLTTMSGKVLVGQR